jgi:hypothetical protein
VPKTGFPNGSGNPSGSRDRHLASNSVFEISEKQVMEHYAQYCDPTHTIDESQLHETLLFI